MLRKKELFPKPIYQHHILIGGPPLAQHAFGHHSTSLRRSLGHAFADTNPSMLNMSSEAFYLLQIVTYNAVTPPPPASTRAVTCRVR